MQTPGAWPLACLFAVLSMTPAFAAETAPWGKGKPQNVDYSPQRVVYDVAVADRAALSRVLDRASYLNNLYQADPFAASIVLVLHGDEIPLFAIENYAKYKELMTRAQSLTVGGAIEIRMCRIAARGHGFDPEDIHGFVQIVPMADAEIVRLQQEDGYAYMQ
jgi:intracellular sulfur oxidation DsrE/DsrF family protein